MSPTTARAAPSQTAVQTTHVYLLRGVLNIFSLGLDTIGAPAQARADLEALSPQSFGSDS